MVWLAAVILSIVIDVGFAWVVIDKKYKARRRRSLLCFLAIQLLWTAWSFTIAATVMGLGREAATLAAASSVIPIVMLVIS